MSEANLPNNPEMPLMNIEDGELAVLLEALAIYVSVLEDGLAKLNRDHIIDPRQRGMLTSRIHTVQNLALKIACSVAPVEEVSGEKAG